MMHNNKHASFKWSTSAGVIAFIEVRSNTENRFDGISKQVEMLGAKVIIIYEKKKIETKNN